MQLQIVVGFLKTSRILPPKRVVLKQDPDLEVAALSLVYTSAPECDDSPAGKHSLTLPPLIFPEWRWRAALETLFCKGVCVARGGDALGCSARLVERLGRAKP